MRFCLQIELALEVQSVADAEAALSRAEQAAHEALGPAAAEISSGAVTRSELTPADQAAVDALEADDLGPGILSVRRSSPTSDP